MNAISSLHPPLQTISTMDLTALAMEAQRIGNLTCNGFPGQQTEGARAQEDRDVNFAYALEDAVLAGTPTKDSDCLAQLVLLVNRARRAADSPEAEMADRIGEVADGLERAIVVLSTIMRIDVLALGARSYFFPEAQRALGAPPEELEAGR